VNRINEPGIKVFAKEGEEIIKKYPPVKSGKANRPRALTTAQEKAE